MVLHSLAGSLALGVGIVPVEGIALAVDPIAAEADPAGSAVGVLAGMVDEALAGTAVVADHLAPPSLDLAGDRNLAAGEGHRIDVLEGDRKTCSVR